MKEHVLHVDELICKELVPEATFGVGWPSWKLRPEDLTASYAEQIIGCSDVSACGFGNGGSLSMLKQPSISVQHFANLQQRKNVKQP